MQPYRELHTLGHVLLVSKARLISVACKQHTVCIAGKIGGTKFWRMSKKGCFGEYNFGVSALAAHVLRPAFILARQNLANNRPFAKFANFYSLHFPLYVIGGTRGQSGRTCARLV